MTYESDMEKALADARGELDHLDNARKDALRQVAEAERQRDDWKARAERAEADNAALLLRLRGVAEKVGMMQATGSEVARGWGKALAPFVVGADDADHPGDALKERKP